MKSKLIVNPAAGTDAALSYLPLISRRLRHAFDAVDIVLTLEAGDATALARRATEDGYDQLFVAGGDGTLNEVLNGVAAVPGGLAAVTLGVIPLGTGNDFAHALGVPEDIERAVDAVAGGSARRIDVGCLNDDHYFVNVSAGGFLAEVSDAVTSRLKSLAGRLAYLIGGAQVLLDYDPVFATVHDNGTRRLSLHAFAVCNSPLVGGGRLIAPDARLDDGWFDVCLIEAMPTMEFVALLSRVSGGEHVLDSRVAYFRTREVQFEFDRTIKVNTDGQVLETSRCDYRLLPGAARVLTPVATD